MTTLRVDTCCYLEAFAFDDQSGTKEGRCLLWGEVNSSRAYPARYASRPFRFTKMACLGEGRQAGVLIGDTHE